MARTLGVEFQSGLTIKVVAQLFRTHVDQRSLLQRYQFVLDFIDTRDSSPFAQFEDAEFEVAAELRPRADVSKALPGRLRRLAPDPANGVWLQVDSTSENGSEGRLVAIWSGPIGKTCRKGMHAILNGIRAEDPNASIGPEEGGRL